MWRELGRAWHLQIGSLAQLIAPKIADAVVTRVVRIIWMPIMWEASMICGNN